MRYKLDKKINPNKPTDPAKWFAVPVYGEKVTTEEVAREIAERSTISPADTEGVLESFSTLLPERLAKGEAVYLRGVGTFRVSISSDGVDNPNDFTVSRIRGKRIIYTPDVKINHALNELIHYEDSGARGSTQTNISWVTDLLSGTSNEKITYGGSVRISGQKIMLAGSDSSVGLKLLHVETNQEFAVSMADIPVNKAKEIVFVVPINLASGHYKIRIVTQYANARTRDVKTPFVYTYEPVFEIVQRVESPEDHPSAGEH
ncbi:MAG: DUF4469 domain-containing protein [Tannerellaceae bacterium]|jgi:predicted histone-like DNA-binding protein|nr:DUF4469 domain-containing protein [Tannerellaceae bacterium]